jgi:hypothetical protein
VPEERDQILTKLQTLLSSFEANRLWYALKTGSGATYSRGKELAWARAARELKALIEEIDPDSLIPVEQPLTWHSDYLEFAEASSESLSRGMVRKCLQCQKCKAGMETEIVKGEPVTKKRIQCSCGHVQLASFFQNGK